MKTLKIIKRVIFTLFSLEKKTSLKKCKKLLMYNYI